MSVTAAVLRFHTMMCAGCTNFRTHMAFLRRAAERFRQGMRGGA